MNLVIYFVDVDVILHLQKYVMRDFYSINKIYFIVMVKILWNNLWRLAFDIINKKAINDDLE